MLRKASAKRKAEALSQRESVQPQRPPGAALQQSTLSFGASPGLRARPENQPEPNAERNVVWHFCDPKGRRLDTGVDAPKPAIARTPARTGAPALAPVSGREKAEKQVASLLGLMKRGKQKKRREEATPARSVVQVRNAPSLYSRALLHSHSHGSLCPAARSQEDNSLLECLHQPPKPSGLGASGSGPSDAAGPSGSSGGLLHRADDDDGTNELLDDMLQLAEKTEPSDAPAATSPGGNFFAETPVVGEAPGAAAAATSMLIDDPVEEPTQKSSAPQLEAAPPSVMPAANAPVTPAAPPAVPGTPAAVQPPPDLIESPLASSAVSASTGGCRNVARQPPSVTSGVVLQTWSDPGATRLRLRLDDNGDGAAADEAGARPPPRELRVSLQDEWRFTPVRAGDRLNLVGELPAQDEAAGVGAGAAAPPHEVVLSQEAGLLLVLRPETTITGTALASAVNCQRRAVLQRQRKNFDLGYELSLGTMKHELVEQMLQAWQRDGREPEWGRAIDEAVARHLPSILALGRSDREPRDELRKLVPTLQRWAADFLPRPAAAGAPPPAALPARHNASYHARAFEAAGVPVGEQRLARVLATEQQLCSLTYGLKGTVDAVLSTEVHAAGPAAPPTHAVPMPLELKTGRRTQSNQTDHMAQVLVYTLLLGERHECRVPSGLLYYTQLGDAESRGMFPVDAEPQMVASLMQQRNTLVAGTSPHASDEGRMPPLLHDSRMCGGCRELQHCALTHLALEEGDELSGGVDELFGRQTAHLSAAHVEYYRHWVRLIGLEERSGDKQRSEMLCLGAAERDALGRCWADMRLLSIGEQPPTAPGGKAQWPHTFGRTGAGGGGRALTEAQINVSDLVAISVQPSAAGARQARWSVATGVVQSVTPSEVVVLLERGLSESGIHPAHGGNGNGGGGGGARATPRLRIDKEELSTGFATCRNNVLLLLAPQAAEPPPPTELHAMTRDAAAAEVGQCSRLLRLVVDLAAPRFGCGRTAAAALPAEEAAHLARLNAEQRSTVERCLGAEDYTLILGMPGTGKTTVIAHAVRALHALGKSVLLSAYTHSALDNIVCKLKQMGVPLLRLGAPHRVHASLREDTLDAISARASGTAALHDELSRRPVVATTALALNHAPLWRRTFDVCIVDEAGQITEPVCLGPLRLARRFVLVGDHYQLPPLVREARAEQLGLGVSLFKRLSEAHPRAVCRLRQQYRMAADIMAVTNELVYGGQLRCGCESVASATLRLPHPERLPRPAQACCTSATSTSSSQSRRAAEAPARASRRRHERARRRSAQEPP